MAASFELLNDAIGRLAYDLDIQVPAPVDGNRRGRVPHWRMVED